MSNCHLVAGRSLIDLVASRLALRAPALRAATALTRPNRSAQRLPCGRRAAPTAVTVDPSRTVAEHGVERGDHLTHHRHDDDLRLLSGGREAIVECFERRIPITSAQRRHVEHVADVRAFDVTRVVYTSAKGVYGPVLGEYGAPTYKPVPEDFPKNPKRIYDSAKLMAEQVGLYYQAHMGVDVVVLRFATTYGPGKTARHGKMGVTSQIVENPANGLPFRLAQGGDEKDDFVYNKDSAHGIYLACTAENPKSRVYNIGTGVGVTLNDVARVIRKYLPHAEIEIGPGLNFLGMPYPASNVYDISRARTELGYAPQYDLERGIADYLDSLKRLKQA